MSATEVIRERADGAYSHIVESGGLQRAYIASLFATRSDNQP